MTRHPLAIVVLFAPLCAQGPGFWEARPALQVARQEVGAAVLGGMVYVAGGFDTSRAAISSVERFDPQAGKWTFVASLPTTLHHLGMAALGGRLYVVGGYPSGFTPTDKCWSYDPTADKWTAIASLPRARGALAAVALGSRIYAVGGVVPQVGVVGDLTAYDPQSDKWTTLTAMNQAREHLGAAALGGKLYAVGGRRGANFDVLEVYDPQADRWTRLKSMPTARGGNGASALGSKLVVMGGENPGIFPETEEYDPATDSWRRLEDMRPGLHGIYAVTLGDEIMVAGGATVAGYGASSAVLSLRMLPDGVSAFGAGTPSCRGAIASFVTHRPLAGESRFALVSAGGPPGSPGVLAIGVGQDVQGSTVLGFRTHLDLLQPLVLFARQSDASGQDTVPLPIPAGAKDAVAFAQIAWAGTSACVGASSSPGMRIAVR